MRFFFVIEAVGVLLLSLSCAVKVKPAKINLTIVDLKNNFVPSASVEFYVNSDHINSNSIDTTVYSDNWGRVAFDTYRDCFLDIMVLKTDGSITQVGTSSVQMQQGKSTTQKIMIQ